jgi:mRNA-degrading endonuclease RelE of RelBE toxin-antitoxin system/DNA-binding XRE family transcriptional regulator
MNQIFWARAAEKQFEKLPSKPQVRILAELDRLASAWPPSTTVKALATMSGYRLRMGNSPGFFVVDEDMIQYPELNEPMTPPAVIKMMHLDNLSRIQAWRKHLGLTVGEIAKSLAVRQSVVQGLEEKDARPHPAMLEKIAATFGLVPSLLIWEDPE